MVTSSKKLTVSYGTFSCTLEGFDDPFTTLQMVAEYFRKLAAEDRYFGGVPRVPDTETLKQIARNATQSDVDAEVDADGIVLRQSNAPAPEAESEALNVAAEVAAAPVVAEMAETTLFRSRRHIPVDEAETAPVAASSDDFADVPVIVVEARTALPKNVEATLAAIRHNVEQAESGVEISSAADEQDEDAVDLLAEDACETLILQSNELLDAADDDANIFDVAQESDAELAETEAAEVEAEIEMTAEDEVEADHEVEAEVEATAEVVAEAEAEIEVAAFVEPAADSQTAPNGWFQIGTDIEAAFEVEDVIEAVAADLPDAEAETELEAFEDAEVVAEAEEEARVADMAPSEAVYTSMLTAEQEAELSRDLEEAMADNAEEVAIVSVDEEAAKRREDRRLRVAALRSRDDLAGEERAMDRLLVNTQTQMDKPDLMRRINALDQLKAAVAATEADQKVKEMAAARGEEPQEEEATDLDAYREDLRRAQSRAHTPLRSGAASLRATPAPLILVSEQRIAEPSTSLDQHRIAPQREVAESHGNLALKRELRPQLQNHDDFDLNDGEIRGIPSDAFSEATTFADFAERVGAVDMVDLLEASAAYASIVDGMPRFSRAQVMSKIAKITPGDAFSKEVGLRAFGKLLREGKILRVQDGQFAISKSSRFSVAARFDD